MIYLNLLSMGFKLRLSKGMAGLNPNYIVLNAAD
jgi:hypothetical protein